jgi:hypothetical protein
MNAIRKLLLGVGVAAVATLWLSPAQAADITIDDFTVPPGGVQSITLTNNPGTVGPINFSPIPTANTAAGQRAITLTQVQGGTSNLTVDPLPSILTELNHGNAAASSNSVTLWDFVTGAGPINLSGQTSIVLQNTTVDVGLATFDVLVNGTSLGAQILPAFLGSQDLTFSLAGAPGLNAVNTIELRINIPFGVGGNTDVTIDNVLSPMQPPPPGVPEPASIALWSLLGLGAVGYARRSWGKGRMVTA